jgi:hypothetical protein
MAEPVNRPLPVQRPGEKSRAVERQAKAKAAESSARAAELTAQKQLVEAQSKAAERQVAINREAAGRTTGERAWQLGVNVVMPLAGVAVGHKVAKSIEKRHIAALAAKAKQVQSLGNSASKLLASKMPRQLMKSKLAGIVSTADKLQLSKVRGPVGLVPAALLLGEGAFSRFVLAKQVENESAREALRAVGTASAFAATNLVGERMIQNRTLAKVPQSTAFAAIEAARAKAGPVAAAVGPSKLRVALGLGGKIALPLTAAMAAYAAYEGYKKEGLKGAGMGVADSLTFGGASAVRNLIRGQRAAPGGNAEGLAIARRAAGRLNYETRASTLRAASGRKGGGDGFTKAYYRVQAGRTQRVAGYRTPTRIR